MRFEWDEEKRQSNLEKHGIDFADAEQVLDSDAVISFPDERYPDDRWIAFGFLGDIAVQVAYQQPHDETIRIISMRKATSRERKHLQEELTKAKVIDPEFVEALERVREYREFHEDMERARAERRTGDEKSEEGESG